MPRTFTPTNSAVSPPLAADDVEPPPEGIDEEAWRALRGGYSRARLRLHTALAQPSEHLFFVFFFVWFVFLHTIPMLLYFMAPMNVFCIFPF